MDAHHEHSQSNNAGNRADAFIANEHLLNPIMLNSESLLQGRRVIEIDHNGQCYRLSKTRQGKLILTK
ncbi:MAG: Hemin uptake protein hemP [Rhizobacter sp.]|nr:Hemin uptake protein hemP [Rhizobacter sp.]